MPDYTTRYLFEIDLIDKDVAKKAQQLSATLDAMIKQTTSATQAAIVVEQNYAAALDNANTAITSQTRRLGNNLNRLNEVSASVRILVSEVTALYAKMAAAGSDVFDPLTQSARKNADDIEGHSIIPDMTAGILALYKQISDAGRNVFTPLLESGKEAEKVFNLLIEQGKTSGAALVGIFGNTETALVQYAHTTDKTAIAIITSTQQGIIAYKSLESAGTSSLVSLTAAESNWQIQSSNYFTKAIQKLNEFEDIYRRVLYGIWQSMQSMQLGMGNTSLLGAGNTPLLGAGNIIDAETIRRLEQGSEAIKDVGDSFKQAQAPMESWIDKFNKGLNEATMRWFGLRRLGYGLVTTGNTMINSGKNLISMMQQAGESYLTFNEAATRAAMAMELQADMQDVLEQKLLDTSKTLGLFKPEELAEGVRLWAAGTGVVIKSEEELNALLEDTVDIQKLAAMNSTALGTATDITGGIMHGFGMEISDVAKITQALNFEAAKTFSSVESIGEALKFVAPLAYQYGISFEEMTATVGILENAQIRGTMAGRDLRQMIIGIADTSPKATKELNKLLGANESLGQSWQDQVFDKEGKFISFANFIDLLAAAT